MQCTLFLSCFNVHCGYIVIGKYKGILLCSCPLISRQGLYLKLTLSADVDILAESDNPTHYADGFHCNAQSPRQEELGLVSCQQPTHRYKRGGHEHVAILNYLERQFAVTGPNQVWGLKPWISLSLSLNKPSLIMKIHDPRSKSETQQMH